MLMVEDVDLTPNPQALKFILNQKLLKAETRQYPDKASASGVKYDVKYGSFWDKVNKKP